MFFKEFYQKNPVAGTYSCSLVSMLICLLGRLLHWIHCGEFWRGKMGCCCSGKMWFKSLRMGKNVKNGNWGLNSFNGIDIPPSGPSLYLTVDLVFIQGCWVILCLKADRHFTRIIMFFVTIYWQLKADEASLVTAEDRVQLNIYIISINGKTSHNTELRMPLH